LPAAIYQAASLMALLQATIWLVDPGTSDEIC
jgi:hypothetical protein